MRRNKHGIPFAPNHAHCHDSWQESAVITSSAAGVAYTIIWREDWRYEVRRRDDALICFDTMRDALQWVAEQ